MVKLSPEKAYMDKLIKANYKMEVCEVPKYSDKYLINLNNDEYEIKSKIKKTIFLMKKENESYQITKTEYEYVQLTRACLYADLTPVWV